LYRLPSRRYKRRVSKSKPSPAKSKQPAPPKPGSKPAAIQATADILATVHAKAKVLSEALP